MELKLFIGIDISKLTLDIAVFDSENSIQHYCIKNAAKDFIRFFKKLNNKENVFIGMENTGRYNWPVYEGLEKINATVFVISPLHLKKSLGLVRGKNDKVDAIRITHFIKNHHLNLNKWRVPIKKIVQLEILLTERNNRVKKIKELKSRASGFNLLQEYNLVELFTEDVDQLIRLHKKQIKDYEKRIEEIIKSDVELNKKADLMRSVSGVGKVLCWTLLSKFNLADIFENPRKLACYAGVVPFDYQSGSSVRGKSRISVFADKKLKTVLHMAALRAIRIDGELKQYYLRKVDEGKNKMLVINAVRNKIIHRICAVLRNMEPYQQNYNNHLVLS